MASGVMSDPIATVTAAETLERAKDAREQFVGDEAGREREQANVNESVADAEQAHQHKDGRYIRQATTEAERDPPQRDTDALDNSEPSPADEHECPDRTRDGAGSDRGGHQRHAGLSGVEELEGHHHEEDVEASARERLGECESEEQARIAVTPHGTEACCRVGADPRPCR